MFRFQEQKLVTDHEKTENMGRTKDLRDNIPFSPGSFGSMEEFAAAIGWDLSTKQPSRSSDARHNGMLNDDFQSLVKDLARAVSDVSKDKAYGELTWQQLEDQISITLNRYIPVLHVDRTR